jgi:tetratricopeptide (TPR) repeat protein
LRERQTWISSETRLPCWQPRKGKHGLGSAGGEIHERGTFGFCDAPVQSVLAFEPQQLSALLGFARVLAAKGKYEEALGFLYRAKQLIDDPYQDDDDPKRAEYFALADQQYEQSISLDPKSPNAWAWWAWTAYIEGEYPEACTRVKWARELG